MKTVAKRSAVFNKFITYYVLVVFVCSKAALESLYTEIPLLTSSFYGLSLSEVGLTYFCMIIVSKLS